MLFNFFSIIIKNLTIFLGFAVLDISKTLIYDNYYDVMRAHYKDDITLMYVIQVLFFFYYLFIKLMKMFYLLIRFSSKTYQNR